MGRNWMIRRGERWWISVPEHETGRPGSDDADVVPLRLGLAPREQGHDVDGGILVDGLGARGGLVVVAVDEGVGVHVYVAIAAPAQGARRTVGHIDGSHEVRIGPKGSVEAVGRSRWEGFTAGPAAAYCFCGLHLSLCEAGR